MTDWAYNVFHFLFVKWNSCTTAWFLLSCIIIIISCIVIGRYKQWGTRKTVLATLTGIYIILLLLSTVFTRRIIDSPHYELSLLWSYRWGHNVYGWKKVLWENTINIVMLIPVSVFLCDLLIHRKRYICVILLCFFLSACIECLQYVLRRGTMEIDDLLHNTIGACIGVLFFKLVRAKKLRSIDHAEI